MEARESHVRSREGLAHAFKQEAEMTEEKGKLPHAGGWRLPQPQWPGDVRIEDIARELSRLNVACHREDVFYSFAEHACRVSWMCPDSCALWGLLSEAQDAYLVWPTHLWSAKKLRTWLREVQAPMIAMIAKRFGLSMPMPRRVYRARNFITRWELRDLGDRTPANPRGKDLPLSTLAPMSAELAERTFLARYCELRRASCYE